MNVHNKQETKQFETGGMRAHLVLILLSLLCMINYMDRQVMSAVLEPMKHELNLSDTQAGALHTVFLISIAMFSFPVAFLVDRWSRRKATSIMAILWSVFTYATGMGKSFLGVLIPRIMVGVGIAGFSSAGTALITAAYPSESRSKVLGIFKAFIPLGSAMGLILGGYLSTYHGGWRTPFYIFAIPGIILGIIAFFLKDYKTALQDDEQNGQRAGVFASAVFLLRIRTLRFLYIGYALQNIMAFSFMIWTPAFLMRAQGINEAKAGMIIGVIGLLAIVGAPIGGIFADIWQKKSKRGRMYFPALTMAISTFMFIVALLFDFKGLGFAAAIVFGVTLMMGLPALGAISQDVVTPDKKSMSWGLNVFCMYILGGGWAPIMVGVISDYLGGGTWGLKIALIIVAFGGILGGILYFLGSKSYPADMEKVKYAVLEEE